MVISISFKEREGKTHGEKLYPYELIFEGNKLFKTKEEAWKFKKLLCSEEV